MTLAAECTHTRTHTHTHTHTVQPVGIAGSVLKGQPDPDLSSVTAVAAIAEALMVALATAPEKGEALRGSSGNPVKPPPLEPIQPELWDGNFHCSGNKL